MTRLGGASTIVRVGLSTLACATALMLPGGSAAVVVPQRPPPPSPPTVSGVIRAPTCPPSGTRGPVRGEKPLPRHSDEGLRNIAGKLGPVGYLPVLLTIADFRSLQAEADRRFGDGRRSRVKLEPTREALRGFRTASGAVVNERRLVAVMGFVTAATEQGAESANCGGADGFDLAVNIGPRPDAAEHEGVLVEMISQMRAPGWTLDGLQSVQRSGRAVLVIGGLFYDNGHLLDDWPGRSTSAPKRASLWEVHPVTEFLICVRPGGCDPAVRADWQRLADR